MSKFLSFLMYLLWLVSFVVILATTFTDFQYEDLNTLAAVFLGFAIINSFLVVTRRGR